MEYIKPKKKWQNLTRILKDQSEKIKPKILRKLHSTLKNERFGSCNLGNLEVF